MNTQTKEKLVSLVASGTDTYEQILRAIPELTENALYYVTHSHLDEERLLSQITPTRYSPEEEHHFLPYYNILTLFCEPCILALCVLSILRILHIFLFFEYFRGQMRVRGSVVKMEYRHHQQT